MSITSKFCRCDILSVEGAPLTETFRGMIRKEDIRAFEKDKVEVYKSFRPGDIVLARVVSLDLFMYLVVHLQAFLPSFFPPSFEYWSA